MNNPIGKIAAALPLAQAAPVQESVIKTLGIVILSNYGKILMLAGAACLIGYAITKISGPRLSPEDQNKVISGIMNNAKHLPLLEGPKAPHMIGAIKLDGNPWIPPKRIKKDQCMRLHISGIMKDVLRLALLKGPKDLNIIAASGNMTDVQGLLLLKGPEDPTMIAAIKLDGYSWIHPDKNNEDQCMTMIFNGSTKLYYMSVNNDTVRIVLKQAGVTDKELSLLPDDAWITLHIDNQKLTEIECYETTKLPLNIEFIFEPIPIF
jgi:hypothetical protein